MTEEKLNRAQKAEKLKNDRDARSIKRVDVSNDQTIRILTDINPRRIGSQPATHWEKYKVDMTVGQLIEAGGSWVHLQEDIQRGYIEIVK
jgi:hypothetical protein